MTKTALFLLRYTAAAAVVLGCAVAQNDDPPPLKPFQTVHLINLASPDVEKKFSAALADMNEAIAKAGCKNCVYHLWKVAGSQAGPFNYLWISSWPARDVYEKIHSSAPYQAALAKHPEIDEVQKTQVYNRYVEVKPGK
jgi:hypothetical protein